MRALLQRVKKASVTVEDKVVGSIDQGLLLFLGCGTGDTRENLEYIVEKAVNLRIFADDEGRMNLSLLDIKAEMLVVSQFTLYANTNKGRRPSFVDAMKPDAAEALYEDFVQAVKDKGVHVETGVFGAMMDVELVNDGPVTIMLEDE